MAFAIFALILIASLVIAILSKRGAVSSDMGDVMTAGDLQYRYYDRYAWLHLC